MVIKVFQTDFSKIKNTKSYQAAKQGIKNIISVLYKFMLTEVDSIL
jgi:hypothetical protein